MGRHFVALACKYESLNPDGSVFHRGTTFLSGFVIDFLGRWYWAGAGHCLQDLERGVQRDELRIVSGSYIDYLGFQAKHFHPYPYKYAPGDGLYIYQPSLGIDFALIPLDELMQASFQANQVIPVGRQNWVHQHRLDFSFYRMLGIPQCRVVAEACSEKNGEMGIGLAMLAIEELGDAADDDHPGMFIGRIHPEATIETIESMSGGPIYGFRFDEQGGGCDTTSWPSKARGCRNNGSSTRAHLQSSPSERISFCWNMVIPPGDHRLSSGRATCRRRQASGALPGAMARWDYSPQLWQFRLHD